jgi:hypothetical protein
MGDRIGEVKRFQYENVIHKQLLTAALLSSALWLWPAALVLVWSSEVPA